MTHARSVRACAVVPATSEDIYRRLVHVRLQWQRREGLSGEALVSNVALKNFAAARPSSTDAARRQVSAMPATLSEDLLNILVNESRDFCAQHSISSDVADDTPGMPFDKRPLDKASVSALAGTPECAKGLRLTDGLSLEERPTPWLGKKTLKTGRSTNTTCHPQGSSSLAARSTNSLGTAQGLASLLDQYKFNVNSADVSHSKTVGTLDHHIQQAPSVCSSMQSQGTSDQLSHAQFKTTVPNGSFPSAMDHSCHLEHTSNEPPHGILRVPVATGMTAGAANHDAPPTHAAQPVNVVASSPVSALGVGLQGCSAPLVDAHELPSAAVQVAAAEAEDMLGHQLLCAADHPPLPAVDQQPPAMAAAGACIVGHGQDTSHVQAPQAMSAATLPKTMSASTWCEEVSATTEPRAVSVAILPQPVGAATLPASAPSAETDAVLRRVGGSGRKLPWGVFGSTPSSLAVRGDGREQPDPQTAQEAASVSLLQGSILHNNDRARRRSRSPPAVQGALANCVAAPAPGCTVQNAAGNGVWSRSQSLLGVQGELAASSIAATTGQNAVESGARSRSRSPLVASRAASSCYVAQNALGGTASAPGLSVQGAGGSQPGNDAVLGVTCEEQGSRGESDLWAEEWLEALDAL